MERKNKVKIPKGFFSVVRPTISTNEALKDVIPVKWEQKPKETIIHSRKKNKTL